MAPPSVQPPDPRPARWVERVPPERHVSWAAAAFGVALILFTVLATRRADWAGAVEILLAAAALAVVFLAPPRIGPSAAFTAAVAYFAVEATAGRLTAGGFPHESIAAGFAFLGALLAATYLRLGIRRRDSELAVASAAIAELTRRDRITELLSAGQEVTWLEAEIARARRHHHQVALVLIEPDGWEWFEERGTEIAIPVLETLAEVIGSELRATDIALRRETSVFSLILPETSSEGARVAAERIRLILPLRVGAIGERVLSVSAGVATFPQDASTNEELVHMADRALDRARELGGNRTVCVSLGRDAPPGWTLVGGSGSA